MLNKNVLTGLLIITVLLVAIPVGVSAQEQQSQRINTIQINEQGDGTWTIEIREPLSNSSMVSNFESYVEQVDSSSNNETTERFRKQFQSVIGGANESHERDMSLESLTVDAEVVNTATGTYGVTTVQFTWINFSKVNNSGIHIGEILSDGYTLSETEKLTIVPPKGYTIDTMPNGATVTENGAIEWAGPYAFSNLDATFMQSGTQNFPIDPAIGVGVITVFIILIAGGVLYSRRSGGDSNWSTSDLQTEEERIVELLENNDGRIKQKMVAEEFDWSDAKVSRVTSSLEEDEVLEKLMIGRENVLELNESDREDN